MKGRGRIALVDEPRFPSLDELPMYERDPTQTCSTCAHLVRLKQHNMDFDGVLTCKQGPQSITTLPGPGGSTAQLASNYVPAHPLQWCFQWQQRAPRGNGNGESAVIGGPKNG